MAKESKFLFDEVEDVLDLQEDRSADFEIYTLKTSEQSVVIGIAAPHHDVEISVEDAIKIFLLLGQAIKASGKTIKAKINIEYEL